jgi:coenzyme F420 hydrogenase subunit beta
MLQQKMKNASDIASWRMCIGCGACFSICPTQCITLCNINHDGIRPVVNEENCIQCGKCLKVCPGIYSSVDDRIRSRDEKINMYWGKYINLYEGYAGDSEIRYLGSSGGICSAVSVFCINQFGAKVLHIGGNNTDPLQNITKISKSRAEVLSNSGSRYSPTSPLDSIFKVLQGSENIIFVGKPCDIAGYNLLENENEELKKRTLLKLGFFCAGTPSQNGTIDLLKENRIERASVKDIRYRGKGWPGNFQVTFLSNSIPRFEVSYYKSWGFLQKYRPLRCYLCPDGTSELADISVGDPWYKGKGDNDFGSSIIITRTKRGQSFIEKMIEKKELRCVGTDEGIILKSQNNLFEKRRSLWGRLVALKLLNSRCPKFPGFPLYECWKSNECADKYRSILGTLRRGITRKYFLPSKR